MEDWKDRLKAEYAQTKERYEKLKAYNNKQEVETYLLKNVAEEPEDMYSRVLLCGETKIGIIKELIIPKYRFIRR